MTITEDEDGKKLENPIEVPASWVLKIGDKLVNRVDYSKDDYTNQVIVNHVSNSSGKYNMKALTLQLGNE